MRVELIEVDSRVFGSSVLAIHKFDAQADFNAFEQKYLSDYHPVYVSCKIPLENVIDVHVLERHGFNLIECQIRSSMKLRKKYDVSSFHYQLLPVTSEEELADVLDIAATTFVRDRFSMDKSLDPTISGKRYKEYIRKSFQATDESVYRLVNQLGGQTVAFKTHKYVSDGEALCLLGGVHPDMKNSGIGVINSYFEFNELMRRGIKAITTHISAINYPVFKLEIGKLGFRVQTTFAVMRKLYPPLCSRFQNYGYESHCQR